MIYTACISEADDTVELYHFDDDKVDFTITIKMYFKVSAKMSSTPVNIRDHLGFQCALERWSQLEAIIARTKNTNLSASLEVTAAIKELQQKLNTCEDDNPRRNFLFDQILRLYGTRRYDAETFKISCDLYLSTRSAYS